MSLRIIWATNIFCQLSDRRGCRQLAKIIGNGDGQEDIRAGTFLLREVGKETIYEQRLPKGEVNSFHDERSGAVTSHSGKRDFFH